MPGGFRNKPKILHGAFVEYGLSLPLRTVVFQFNPLQLSRNRSLTFSVPNAPQGSLAGDAEIFQQEGTSQDRALRQFHQNERDLLQIQKRQQVTVQEEAISFDIRLDATDKLNAGDRLAEQFGLAPQLAALELMILPREASLLGGTVRALLGASAGFSFTSKAGNPPMILFIWGRKRVLPVNITSMKITETEFSTDLNPLRATVAVSLKVIEGPNKVYQYARSWQEASAALHLPALSRFPEVIIPR